MEITVQDFDNVVKIIDIVTQRGAFRGEELKGVAEVREKFVVAIQKYVEEQQKAQAAKDQPQPTVAKELPNKKANSGATVN
jgi:hypothetical protein